MQLRLPSYRGEIVKKYLETLELDKVYDAFTIDMGLGISSCKGIIQNDGNENILYIVDHKNIYQERWFTLDMQEAIEVQKRNVEFNIVQLQQEIKRLKSLL